MMATVASTSDAPMIKPAKTSLVKKSIKVLRINVIFSMFPNYQTLNTLSNNHFAGG